MTGYYDDYSHEDFYDNKSDYEKRELYDFEVYKPLIIEKDIREKNLNTLKDDLMIYASGVEGVLSERDLMQPRPGGLDQIMIFLKQGLDSYNLHVLRVVWDYGVKVYFHENHKYWPEVIGFIGDLIYKNDNTKMLKFLINKVKLDTTLISLKINEENNKLSGGKRKNAFGTLFDASIYYNNIYALKLLLPDNPSQEIESLEDYLKNGNKSILDVSKLNLFEFAFSNYGYLSINTLCSDNPILYAFDNGSIEALDFLIKKGYIIDFKTLDFTYHLAYLAHIDTIEYLYNNFKDEFKNLEVDIVLKSTNYILLRILLNLKIPLGKNSINKILEYDDNYHEFNDDNYNLIKAKNVEICIDEIIKNDLKFPNINFLLIYTFNIKLYAFLDKCVCLWDTKETLDISSIISYLNLDINMLKHLKKYINIYCDFDQVEKSLRTGIRDFKKLLEIVDFKVSTSNSLNEVARGILDLNAVTSIPLLYNTGFITSQNSNAAVDYIVEEGLEKLLPRLILHFNSIGGLGKNYDI